MAASSETVVPWELYEFTKAYLRSAEKALRSLEDPSTVAKLFSGIVSAVASASKGIGKVTIIAGISQALALAVPYLSQEIWQKRKKYKAKSALSTDCSKNFQDVFKSMFILTAIKVYYAFKFQLENVYLRVDGNGREGKLLALEMLGNYSGEKCFKQWLKTGSPENLHLILVPSINSKSGYDFDDEAKTTWDRFSNFTEDNYEKIIAKAKLKLTGKLCYNTLGNSETETTPAEFFDKCIPGFHPDTLEKEMKVSCSSNEIFVDKKKWKKTKLNQYYLLRSPFKIEAEKIKADNLLTLVYVPSGTDRRNTNYFICEDYSHLTDKILEKINLDESYNHAVAHFHLTLKQGAQINEMHSDVMVQGLQINEMKESVNVLVSRLVNAEKNLPSRIWFQVPHAIEYFVGRKNILDEIKFKMEEQKKRLEQEQEQPGYPSTVISQAVIISGLGGVGKTTIAKQFISKFSHENPGSNVVFIFAESSDSLEKSFFNLVLYLDLDIPTDQKDYDWEKVKIKLYERLCDRRCLIVFDNAVSLKNEGDTKNGIEKFLPSLPIEYTNNLSILITTRNNAAKSWGYCDPIPMDVFTVSESFEFVTEMLKSNKMEDNEKKNKRKLVDLCGNLPLALQLTLAFITENNENSFKSGYTIAQFLNEDKIKILVGKENDPEANSDKNEKTLYATWYLSLKNISKLPKGELALLILNIMAFSNQPDMMDWAYFKSYFFQAETEKSLGEALGLLVKYSLISQSDDPKEKKRKIYSIHRIVQMVTKEMMVGNIEKSLKFFVSLASNFSHIDIDIDSKEFSEESMSCLIRSLFSWVGDTWKAKDTWNFTKEIVGVIMGKENVIYDSSLMTLVNYITMKYLNPVDKCDQQQQHRCKLPEHVIFDPVEDNRLFWNFPECLIEPASDLNHLRDGCDKSLEAQNTSTKHRLVFLASETWMDFQRKARALGLKKKIILGAKKYIEDEHYILSKVLNPNVKDSNSKVLLTVLIEKVQEVKDSGVWFINSRDKKVPQDLCIFSDREENDIQIVFFLLPFEYSHMFGCLLKLIYDLNWRNSSKMCYLVGLNIIAPIVSKAKVPNEIATIQSLVYFFLKGELDFSCSNGFSVTYNDSRIFDFDGSRCKRITKIIHMLESIMTSASNQLSSFCLNFVISAENALRLLEQAIVVKAEPSSSVPCPADSYVNKEFKATATRLSVNQEIGEKLSEYKIKKLFSNDPSQNSLDVFVTVFLSAALEIYYAFKFQLQSVCMESGSKLEAVEILGRYAGERCFQQLLKTGSPQNLHRVLVPSIQCSAGYEKLEDKAKTQWKSLENFTDTQITEITSRMNTKLPLVLSLEMKHTTRIIKKKVFKTTLADFFDKFIPGFSPNIPAIKTKLEEQNLAWTSESIVVDRTKMKNIGSNNQFLLRCPFKIEVENIKGSNLKMLKHYFTEAAAFPKTFISAPLYMDCVVDKIFLENWELSSATPHKLSKGELALLILNCLTFFPEMKFRESEASKPLFCRGETEEALELLLKHSVVFKHEGPKDCKKLDYLIHPVADIQTRTRMLGNIKDSLKLFLYLASTLDCNLGSDPISVKTQYENYIQILFSFVSDFWNDKDAWNFAKEIVKTMMGKELLDCTRIQSAVYAIAIQYFTRRDPLDEICRNLFCIPVRKRVLFLISETLEDFKRDVEALCLSPETCKIAEKYFEEIVDKTRDSEFSKVLLYVCIGKVENCFDSRVWVVNSKFRAEDLPEDLCNLDWQDEDSQSMFLLLPSQYHSIITILLDTTFRWCTKVHYFIGANILAEIIVSCSKDPNPIDTIHSLTALIGKCCEICNQNDDDDSSATSDCTEDESMESE